MTRWACLSGIAVIAWSALFTWMSLGLPKIIPGPIQLTIAVIISMLLITFIEAALILGCLYFIIVGPRDKNESP